MKTNRARCRAAAAIIGLLVLSAGQPAIAQSDVRAEIELLKKRIAELESAVGEKNTGELDKMTQDTPVSASGSSTAPAHSTGTTLPAGTIANSFIRNVASNTTVGGYISSEFEDFENQPSAFDQHRLVLNVSSRLHKRLHFYSEIEYEHGPSISSEGSAGGELNIVDADGDGVIDADEAQQLDLSLDADVGGGELAVEQAWAQYDITENLGLRTGIILVPFGRFNLYHDDDLWNFSDRPVVDRRVIPTTWSEAGLGLVASHPVGSDGKIGAELYLINGLTDEISTGSAGLRDARGNGESDNNNNKAVVGRVNVSPALGHEVALSGYTGVYNGEGDAINGFAADALATFGDLRLLGEYALMSIENGPVSNGLLAPENLSGLFAEANYSFWFAALNNTPLGESFESPKLIASFRYNWAEIERRNGDESLDEDGYVIGLAYRPVETFVLKTEFQFNDGDLERRDADGFMTSIAMGF